MCQPACPNWPVNESKSARRRFTFVMERYDRSTRCDVQFLAHETDVLIRWIVLQKSKIERRRKSRKSRFLDDSAAAMLCSADTKLRGRFSEKRCGPLTSPREKSIGGL